jgi:CIC family chloride channel protein
MNVYTSLQEKIEDGINLIKSKLSRRQFILFSSIVVGASSATAAILLKWFVHLIFEFATHNRISNYKYFYLFLPMIGILLTVYIVGKVLGGKLSKGLAQIHASIAKKSSFLPRRNMFDQLLTSSLTVGFGGSTGLEAPIVITGAAFGSNYSKTYRLNYSERTLLLACGISAGIAAAFNAPIAGVLFALEVLLVDISISAFTPLIIASATGALISIITLNDSILLNFKSTQSFNYWNLPFYILLGVFAGLVAVYHTRTFFKVEHYLSKSIKKPIFRILVAGFFLAVMIAIFPPLFGEGYQSIKLLAEKQPEQLFTNSIIQFLSSNELIVLSFVGLLIFLKSIATALTIGGGGNGGNFAPSLFIGAYLGFFVSRIVNYFKIAELPENNFTLVGMAGILSGLYHAPLTSIFLIAEITGGYSLMIPLMIVSSISFAVSKYFEPFSMDAKNLAKKGETFTTDKDFNVLTTIKTVELIEKDYPHLSPFMSLRQLVEIVSTSKRNIFPVVSDDKNLLGVVLLDDIREIMFKPENYDVVQVKELMRTPLAIIQVDDNMNQVMKYFDETSAWILPVVKDYVFVGFISKSNVFSGYREKLKDHTID